VRRVSRDKAYRFANYAWICISRAPKSRGSAIRLFENWRRSIAVSIDRAFSRASHVETIGNDTFEAIRWR